MEPAYYKPIYNGVCWLVVELPVTLALSVDKSGRSPPGAFGKNSNKLFYAAALLFRPFSQFFQTRADVFKVWERDFCVYGGNSKMAVNQ